MDFLTRQSVILNLVSHILLIYTKLKQLGKGPFQNSHTANFPIIYS